MSFIAATLLVLQAGSPPLVVEGVLLAESGQSTTRGWSMAFPMRQVGAAHHAASLFVGFDSHQGVNPDTVVALANGTASAHPAVVMSWPFGTGPLLTNHNQPILALLHGPSGDRIVYHDIVTDALIAQDLLSGQISGPVQLPAGALRWTALQGCGDLNADGWEDFFFQADDFWTLQSGLVDGQSLSALWAHSASGLTSSRPAVSPDAERQADFDGDGTADFLSAGLYWNATITGQDYRLDALSGDTGALLWSVLVPFSPSPNVTGEAHCSIGHDVSDDGVPDVAVLAGDVLAAIDGASGTFLWQVPVPSLLAYLPSGTQFVSPLFPVFWDAVAGAPGESCVCLILEVPNAGITSEYHVLRFDGESGAYLSLSRMPDNLMPWASAAVEGTVPSSDHRFYNLGDIDNDGFTELAKTTPTFLTTSWGTSWFYPHMAILATETMSVATPVNMGGQAVFAITVPSSPCHLVQIVLSSRASAPGGVWADGWPTYLAGTRLLGVTSTLPRLSAVLDAAGQATVDLPIPGVPALVGRRYYARAIVFEQGGVGVGIRTMSNLSSFVIAP